MGYRIEFSGWAYADAETEEEALELFENGELNEEYGDITITKN